jgi:hypothetical protein
MPPIEDQRRPSVTYARTSAFSELDHQLIGHPGPNVGPLPTSRPFSGDTSEQERIPVHQEHGSSRSCQTICQTPERLA